MRNLSVYVEGSGRVVNLDEAIRNPRTMTVRHATVFWRFVNVTSANNAVSQGGRDVTLIPGYWDFEAVRERLSSENILLSRNVPDRTCNVLSKGGALDLKNLGPLLGFPKDTTVLADVQTKSPGPVDILRGLRYLDVRCDAVDIRMSTDTAGGRSTILASLPVVSYEPLNSSASSYPHLDSAVATTTGDIYRLEFSVEPNVPELGVVADVLLDLLVE